MIPKELAKKIRYIQIYTSKAVNDVLAGEYHSVFKGRGMEFDEVREYTPGDEIRTIDWNVTARMGHPFVKRYVEERELTVLFLVDLSASGTFGSVDRLKNEVAAELCALLAFSAIKNNDKVGLIIFTDKIEKFVPPKKGKKHVLRVVRELLYHKPEGRRTDLALAIEYMNRIVTRRAVAFMISDFQAQDYETALRVAARRHDMIAITITDPRELTLPNVGFIELEDAETGQVLLVDTSDATLRTSFAENAQYSRELRERVLRKINIDRVDIVTDRPYAEPLIKFFRERAKRFR